MRFPLKNTWTHLWGTTVHKFWVTCYILGFILELLKRALRHDLSKFSREERTHFFRVIHRLRSLTYGSPEYDECLKSLEPALKHHYLVNSHHPEHYPGGLDMFTLADLIEMFCDWRAAVRRHENGDIKHSIEVNQRRFNISEQLHRILKNSVR